MNGENIYLITSGKGGVGKSTFAINIALTLALLGKRTLIADCDTKNRAVDLLLGYEDSGMFDLLDVAEKRVFPTEAVLTDPRCERLYYTTIPRNSESCDIKATIEAAISCSHSVGAEFLIIDTSGDMEYPASVYEVTSFKAIIVATQSATAIRAAEKTGSLLAALGVDDLHLIINAYVPNRDRRGHSVVDMIDATRIPLLGVVMYDEKLKKAQEHGKPAAAVEESSAADAFYNIALRMCGFEVPLFRGIHVLKRRSQLTPKSDN